MSPAGPDFAGTERFELLGRLGAGANGVVYRARDRGRSSAEVALKVLRHPDPDGILRFKREFRALADVTHPNLVTLHELVLENGHWFFTMELVQGVDFLRYVRPGPWPTAAADEPATLRAGAGAAADAAPVARAPAVPALDEARLRRALRDLVEGVRSLHRSNRLHRDLKPSNVLVAADHRVVVLDFGLVAELERSGAQSSSGQVVGTVAYMAPEQATDATLTAAADWYGVGVMLYEALCGRPPFVGSVMQVLVDKQRVDPPAPSSFAAGVPPDLEALCLQLLRRDAAQRPDAEALLRALGPHLPLTELGPAPPPRPAEAAFVGREAQLAELADAFARTARGQAAAVFVRGRSGDGKTALARRFLQDVEGQAGAIVLSGRCYERELVPFKTLDSLVDALGRSLGALPRDKVEALLPRDVHALAQVFPVLRRLEAVTAAPHRPASMADPQELRRRAFAALRELFARMSDRARVVLFIDDLQWGDSDSAALLLELLRPPDSPALLLLTCFRSEDAEACAGVVDGLGAVAGEDLHVRSLEVGALDDAQATALAEHLLRDADPEAARQAAQIARESRGCPFLVHALAGHLASAAAPTVSPISVENVMEARLRRLSADARRLLEVVAVFGAPLRVELALQAARLVGPAVALTASLRAEQLLRTTQRSDGEALECFHDRVREAAVAPLEKPARQAIHRALAQALEAAQGEDAEGLARHWAEAGEPERAGAHAASAAVRAAEALAFHRAAALFRRALELLPAEDPRRRALFIGLAEAQVNAGRGGDAADAFFAAAGAPGSHPLLRAELYALRRRAAEQLLRSGHVDLGLAALEGVLEGVQMRLARTPRRALLSLAWRRVQVRLRGLSYREQDTSQISAETLARIDTCWVAAQGLGMLDPVRAADFQARHLLLALRAGEPYRVARALATDACFSSLSGDRTRARTARRLRQCREIAERIDHPHALGLGAFAEGLGHFLAGRWRAGLDSSVRAEQTMRERGGAQFFEIVNAQLVSLWCLFYLGDLAEFARRVPLLRQEAAERGDLYALTGTGLTDVLFLVTDQPGTAQVEVEDLIGRWSSKGFHFQHYWSLLARGLRDCYVGEARAAWSRVQDAWPHLRRSLLMRVQLVRIEALHLRAHSALAAAASGLPAAPLLKRAEADAARLVKERTPFAIGLSRLLEASVAEARGRPERAAQLLGEADRLLCEAEVSCFAAAARWRKGELQGGAEGRALTEAARDWLAARTVKNPERMVRMMVQAFPPR